MKLAQDTEDSVTETTINIQAQGLCLGPPAAQGAVADAWNPSTGVVETGETYWPANLVKSLAPGPESSSLRR